MLRLASQRPLVKGDDVEESQFRVSLTIAGEDEYVEFWPAGTLAKGQFACTACGNRVTVTMCSRAAWCAASCSGNGPTGVPSRGLSAALDAVAAESPRRTEAGPSHLMNRGAILERPGS